MKQTESSSHHSSAYIFQGIGEVPMQFPKAAQWWSNPLMLVLQILQYLTLENDEEFCIRKIKWKATSIFKKRESMQ